MRFCIFPILKHAYYWLLRFERKCHVESILLYASESDAQAMALHEKEIDSQVCFLPSIYALET